MARVVFRVFYGALLVALFLAGAWMAFQRSIVGRAVPVPDLTGKSMAEALAVARGVGLRMEVQTGRARSDDRVARGRILLQQPEGGSLAKPSQIVRVVLSLGPRDVKVPDLTSLPPRAATLRLSQESLQLGAVSWYRDARARVGIVAQDPEPESPVEKDSVVSVLTNRGLPERRYVMPDLVGRDAEKMRVRLETYGLRVGSSRYETYEGITPDTVLKQFPPAGYPIANPEVVSLTVSRAAEVPAAAASR